MRWPGRQHEHEPAARAIAEELVLPQRVLPDPELAADNQDDVPPESGERPMVVERDHPSWAEVDAEQQERIHGPASADAPHTAGAAVADRCVEGDPPTAGEERPWPVTVP
jgi:hypothetical protein